MNEIPARKAAGLSNQGEFQVHLHLLHTGGLSRKDPDSQRSKTWAFTVCGFPLSQGQLLDSCRPSRFHSLTSTGGQVTFPSLQLSIQPSDLQQSQRVQEVPLTSPK